jgi:hypothetical protein
VHVIAGMNDPRSPADRLDATEGADAALGTTPPPEQLPPDAQEPVDMHLVPGATHGDRIADEAKPWFTSLAAESEQAGVANDAPDAQAPDTLDPDAEAR